MANRIVATTASPVTNVVSVLVVRSRITTEPAAPATRLVEAPQLAMTGFPVQIVAKAFLDKVREEAGRDHFFHQAVIGSAVAVSTSFSVGYVVWLIRGGVLLSSVLSSLPARQLIGPLPVLGFVDDDEDDSHDDSLESLVENSNSENEDETTPA